MTEATEPAGRPDVWIGHVDLRTPDLDGSETFMKDIGLRPIFRGDEVAVLELRGGTHIVLILDTAAEGAEADFDFMVEDLDAIHARYAGQGLAVDEISRGKIHDWFWVTEPGGNRIKFNSTHVPDHSLV